MFPLITAVNQNSKPKTKSNWKNRARNRLPKFGSLGRELASQKVTTVNPDKRDLGQIKRESIKQCLLQVHIRPLALDPKREPRGGDRGDINYQDLQDFKNTLNNTFQSMLCFNNTLQGFKSTINKVITHLFYHLTGEAS